ncbi:MAG: hypothetical protein GY951_10790 [Psychromonas sp.]|nr:hypothetical protein [Alteromonadales bacterium]MCP5078525.1 hypothetical protein [Psychromonas sp.]
MANFNTHLNVAAVTTGLSAAALLSAEHISLSSAIWLWLLGTIGGLLPDIDSDNSTSLDTLFNLFALSAVLIVIRYITAEQFVQISFIELIAIPLLVYAVMRYLLRPIFEKITVHRGSCHSLLFLFFIALLTTQITWRVTVQATEQSIFIAWLSGGFILLGGVVHLLLDEIYSVDLSNISIKRSFGTALKLAEFKNKILTLLTVIAIITLTYITPSPSETIDILSNWDKFKLKP